MSDKLIRSLQGVIRSGRLLNSLYGGEIRPFPPAPLTAVQAAEAEIGFCLPELLKRMYVEIGNGGFGPFFGLLGLEGGATDDLGNNALDWWFNARQDLAVLGRRKPLPEGSLFPCFYCGCNAYSCWDGRNPDGPMWRYDLSRRGSRQFEPEGFTLAGLMVLWSEGPADAEPVAVPKPAG